MIKGQNIKSTNSNNNKQFCIFWLNVLCKKQIYQWNKRLTHHMRDKCTYIRSFKCEKPQLFPQSYCYIRIINKGVLYIWCIKEDKNRKLFNSCTVWRRCTTEYTDWLGHLGGSCSTTRLSLSTVQSPPEARRN